MREKERKKLRELIEGPGIMLPGVFNAATALLAANAGFKGLYVSGAGLNNGCGFPDIGLLSMSEFINLASYITQSVNLPVISDADTGFGEAVNVIRCVQEFEKIGMAGIHIEDQTFPKRCGHLEGKSLISTDAMCAKIHAASISKTDKNFLIIARTDARSVESMEDAVDRAHAYIKAGADAIFPEALKSKEEFEYFSQHVKVPLLANMTEFGISPLFTFEQLTSMGYKMVIYPMTAFRVTMKACENLYSEIAKTGTQTASLDKMQTRKELYEMLDYEKYAKQDEKISGYLKNNGKL